MKIATKQAKVGSTSDWDKKKKDTVLGKGQRATLNFA